MGTVAATALQTLTLHVARESDNRAECWISVVYTGGGNELLLE